MAVTQTTVPVAKIKTGDTVVVIAGRAKGRQGKVLSVDRHKRRLVVEKINMMKRHMRPTRQAKGGIIEKEAPLHLSNVMLVCPACGKPTRVAQKRLEDGKRLRACRRCQEVVEQAKRS